MGGRERERCVRGTGVMGGKGCSGSPGKWAGCRRHSVILIKWREEQRLTLTAHPGLCSASAKWLLNTEIY